MEAVGNDLSLDIGVLHAGGDGTGVAVVDGGHGVVQVGQMGDAGINGSLGIVVGAVGVGDGHGAQILGLGHEFGSAGQFRGDIHDGDQTAAAIVQLLEALEIRLLQIVGILSAPLLVGEIGTLHLDAAQHAVALGGFFHQLLGRGEGLFQHIVGQGHGSRGEGGDTALGKIAGHGLQAFVVTIGEVSTGVAVAVDFDQTGDDSGAAQIDGVSGDIFRQNFTENAVLHFEGAGMELEIGGENAGIGIEHDHISFIIIL